MSGLPSRSGAAPSRREVLGALGTAGAVSVAGCGLLGGDEPAASDGADDEAITVGVSIPQDGRWRTEGEWLHDGYRLAARHINEGAGAMAAGDGYEPPFELSGEGLLGRPLELEVRDTGSTTEGARASARELAAEGVAVIAGGGSVAEGLGHQAVAAETETVYMGGFTPTSRVAGEDCSFYGFNELQVPRMAADALGAALAERYGANAGLAFAQVHPESAGGRGMAQAVQSRFEARGWSQNVTASTRVGSGSYGGVLEDVLETAPDLVVLNYTGLDGASALRDFREVADSGVDVVVPLMNRILLENARAGLEGVLGTVPWTPALSDPFSERFVESWTASETESEVPSGIAHLAYVQLSQYAAAVERAGSIESSAVVPELEGTEYDVGLGRSELRGCDHQSTRGVPVVRGRPEADQEPGRYAELVDVVEAGYDCSETPAADCEV